MENTINERLKFLIGQLNLSARAFSVQLRVPESNTRNYLDKNTKLNSDYLERIANQFKSVNLSWLITGAGEPFLPGTEPTQNISAHKGKGSINSTGGGTNTINNYSLDDCKRDLVTSQKELEHLKQQLELKDALLAAKEEMLVLLRGSRNNSN